jgi:hypothetical protein
MGAGTAYAGSSLLYPIDANVAIADFIGDLVPSGCNPPARDGWRQGKAAIREGCAEAEAASTGRARVAGGKHVSASYEGWIAADLFKGGFRLIITGSHGFERHG